ncbi:MFS transporter [Haloarchaeobius salinus]|uniref:MFS transporter n=1 Tax=Haloarchaeobius salinus TaxID=1198298 RepID=UPI00210DD097|nr:MFS transporter [Haloarchaeobius salinus]
MSGTGAPDEFYSWVVALVGAFASIFTFGTPYSFGVFLRYFGPTYPFSEVLLSSIFSLQLFMFFAGGGILGVLISKVPARRVLIVSGAVLSLLAPSLFVVESIYALAFVFATMGVILGTVYVVLASTIPRWFDTYRGTGTGILFAGNGLSLFLVPPAWHYTLDTLGVRQGFFVFLVVTAVPVFFAGLICRDPPWVEDESTTGTELYDWVVGIWRSNDLTYQFAGVAFSLGWYSLLSVFTLGLFESRGLSASRASLMFGFIGGISIFSRLGSGVVADRIGAYPSYLLSMSTAGVATILLFVPSILTSLVAVVLFGLGLGGAATLYIPVLLEMYDPERSTAVIGVFTTAFGVTSLVLPLVGTAIVSNTESYVPVIAFTLATILLGMYCWWRV